MIRSGRSRSVWRSRSRMVTRRHVGLRPPRFQAAPGCGLLDRDLGRVFDQDNPVSLRQERRQRIQQRRLAGARSRR